jgi:FtsZ-binding cell division protein ZapB
MDTTNPNLMWCDGQLAAEYERLVDKNNNDNLNFADILSEREDEIEQLKKDQKFFKDAVVEALGGPEFNGPYKDCIRLRDITCEIGALKSMIEQTASGNNQQGKIQLDLEEQVEELKENVKDLKVANQNLRDEELMKSTDLKEKNDTLVEEHQEQIAAIHDLEKEVANLKEENDKYQDPTESEKSLLKKTQKGFLGEIEKLKEKNDTLVEEHQEQIAAIHDLEKEVSLINSEEMENEEKIAKLVEENEELEKAHARLTTHFARNAELEKELKEGWSKTRQSLINEFMERSDSWSDYYSWLDEHYPDEHKAEMEELEELEIGDTGLLLRVKKEEEVTKEVTKCNQTEEDILKTYREEIGKIEKEFEEIEDIVDVLPFLQKLKQSNEDGCKLMKALMDKLHPLTTRVLGIAVYLNTHEGEQLERSTICDILGFTPEFLKDLEDKYQAEKEEEKKKEKEKE